MAKKTKSTPEQNFNKAFSSGDISTQQINKMMSGETNTATGKSGTTYVAKMTGRAYDAKMAYNKNLTASARLHYLENERHDAKSGSSMSKHMGGRMSKKK